jgi:hypothetical protein
VFDSRRVQNPGIKRILFFYTFRLYQVRGLLGRFLALVSWAGPQPTKSASVGARPTARAFLPQFRAVPSFRALGGGGAIHWYGLAPPSPHSDNPKGARWRQRRRSPRRIETAFRSVRKVCAPAMSAHPGDAPLTAANNIQVRCLFPVRLLPPPFTDAKLMPSRFFPFLSSCSRSSSSTRQPRPPLRRCRPPGLGGGLMPHSRLPPTPNRRRGPVMLMRRMRKTRSCTSSSAWRPSTESGPGSSPLSMYAPLASL